MKKALSFLIALSLMLVMCPGVVLTAQADEEPVTLTIFIDHSWYPVETFTGIIPEEITRLTGVVLDPTIAIDNNQLGVMIASGEMPDLVYTQNMVDRMSDPEVALCYEDLIEQYNVDWNISDKQLGIARGYSEDGRAYTLLNHYSEKSDWEGLEGVAPMLGSLSIRGDLLEAIGNPSLNSFDDLYEAFGLIKEAYADVVPLKLNENWNTAVFRNLNGMGEPEYVEQEDGTYIHYTEDARYKELLIWLNKCFRSGYIVSDDPYFVSGSTAIADDKYFAGATCTQNGIPNSNGTLAQIDPSYYLFEMPPFEESSYITSDLGWSGTFITTSCKDPETAINFIAWMFTDEAQKLTQMGREGIEYTLNESGLPVFSDEWKDTIAAGSNEQNKVYNTWFYFGASEIVEAISRCATTDQSLVDEAYAVMRERFDNQPWIKASMPVGDSDEKVIYDKLKTLIKSYEAKVILCETEEEAEAMYDEFMSNAERTGLSTLDEYVNQGIAENMPLYQ